MAKEIRNFQPWAIRAMRQTFKHNMKVIEHTETREVFDYIGALEVHPDITTGEIVICAIGESEKIGMTATVTVPVLAALLKQARKAKHFLENAQKTTIDWTALDMTAPKA